MEGEGESVVHNVAPLISHRRKTMLEGFKFIARGNMIDAGRRCRHGRCTVTAVVNSIVNSVINRSSP